MAKRFTKKTSYVIMLVFLFSLFANSVVSAIIVTPAPPMPFKDVSPSFWAVKNIVKMYARGVTSGYSDGTFKPNNPVTQLEAVLMAVKNMALPSQVAAVDASQPLPVSVPLWAEVGNKKDILFAVQKGLIVPSENNFDASANASRAWVAQLVVRVIDKNSEASQMASQRAEFTDAVHIPLWALGYVNAAYKYKLISGYPDNSFKPNQNVTRAEMITILSGGEQYLGLGQPLKVLSISDQDVTVAVNNVAKAYTLTSNTWVFDAEGRYTTTGTIQADDYVKIIISGNNARYVEIMPPDTSYSTLKGTVLQVIPKDMVIVVKDENQVIHTYTLAAGVTISSQNGEISDPAQIASGSQVELKLNSSYNVVSVQVLNSTAVTSSLGIVYQIDQGQKLIILKDPVGKLNSYQYSDQLQVVIPQIRFPAVSELQPGDEVKITVSGNVVTQIELVQVQKQASISGTIMVLSTDKRIVTIQTDDDELKAYPVSDTAQITLSGNAAAQLADILVNDRVDLTVQEGKVTAIKVNDRNAQTIVTGIVEAIDTTNRIITISTNNEGLKAYEVNTNAQFVINDSTTTSLSAVKKDMKVEIQIVNDKVIYLELKNTVEGIVESLDQNRRVITLDNGSTSQTYILDSSVDVDIDRDSSANLSDVYKNDYVSIRIEDNVVTKINVRRTYNYEVTDVLSSQLRVRDDDGDSRYLSLNNVVTLIVPGITHPDVEDFTSGDVVRVTFMGTKIDKVEATAVNRGKITAIDNYNNKVTVQLFDGTSKVFNFGQGSEVVIGSQQNSQINALITGDRVEVRERTDGGETFSVMTKVSTKFQSYTSDGNKVYVASDPIHWLNYVVSAKVYVHYGNESLALRNLAREEQIDLYLLNDVVYEIEKK